MSDAEKSTRFHNDLKKITYSVDHPVAEPSNRKINQVVTTTTLNQTSPSLAQNTASNLPTSQQQNPPVAKRPSTNYENKLASVISQKVQHISGINIGKNHYGNDASVVITADEEKSAQSVGRYSSRTDNDSFKSTDFGTVIGGINARGQSQFSVIKPGEQDSSLRSKVHNSHKRVFKSLKKKT